MWKNSLSTNFSPLFLYNRLISLGKLIFYSSKIMVAKKTKTVKRGVIFLTLCVCVFFSVELIVNAPWRYPDRGAVSSCEPPACTLHTCLLACLLAFALARWIDEREAYKRVYKTKPQHQIRSAVSL